MKSQNLIMLDNWEASTLLIRMMKKTKKSFNMRGGSWKCLWTLICRAKKGTESPSNSRVTGARLQAPNKVPKTKYACTVEAHESTRQPLEPSLPKNHEDHIAGKGYNSMTHYNLAHMFILVPQAMKLRDAKAAVDKEWKKLETIPAWQLEKGKSKKEVKRKAQQDKRKASKCGMRAKISEVPRSSRTSRRHRKRRPRSPRSIYCHLRHKWTPQSDECHC